MSINNRFLPANFVPQVSGGCISLSVSLYFCLILAWGIQLTRIILVRHGQTEWNRDERFRGRADLALDETGMRQAEVIAERIANWQISALYTSPLKRAIMTAETFARRLNLAVQPLDGLIDINYGRWQGCSPEEVAEHQGELYTQWRQYPHEVCFPEGEGLQQVRQRAAAVLEWVSAQHADQTVVLVSHKVVCKVLICIALGLDNSHFWQIEQDVGAVNVLQMKDGNLAVVLVNDTCHLGTWFSTRPELRTS